MIAKANNTSQAVQPKSARKLAFFIVSSIFLGAIFTLHNTNPVFAEYDCNNPDYDGRSNHLYIDSEGASYLGGSLPSSANWDKDALTLTLDGYDGAPICFDSVSAERQITINLKNTNTIDLADKGGPDGHDHGFAAIAAKNGNLIIDGSGELIIDTTEKGDGIYASSFIQNGGKINIIGGPLEDGDMYGCINNSGVLIINDGEFSSNCSISALNLIINNGTLKVSEVGLSHGACIDNYHMAIGGIFFNGGTVDIDCGDFSAIHAYTVSPRTEILDMLDGMPYERDGDNIIIPPSVFGSNIGDLGLVYSLKAPLVFNGGDVSLKGGNSSTPVIATIAEGIDEQYTPQLKDEAFHFGEGVVAPSYSIETFDATDEWDDVAILMTYFIDENSAPVNALRIYKTSIPVPAADDNEENPNTLDTQLLTIISAVVVSIIAEAFIILDLKKRTQSLQSRVEAKDADTNADYLDSISPKSKKNR